MMSCPNCPTCKKTMVWAPRGHHWCEDCGTLIDTDSDTVMVPNRTFLAERERCAKVAESWCDPENAGTGMAVTGCNAAFGEGLNCTATAGIASEIRKGPQ